MPKITLNLDNETLTRLDYIAAHNHRSRPEQVAHWIWGTLDGRVTEAPAYDYEGFLTPRECLTPEERDRIQREQAERGEFFALAPDGRTILDQNGDAVGELGDAEVSSIAAGLEARQEWERSQHVPFPKNTEKFVEQAIATANGKLQDAIRPMFGPSGVPRYRVLLTGYFATVSTHVDVPEQFVANVSTAELWALLEQANLLTVGIVHSSILELGRAQLQENIERHWTIPWGRDLPNGGTPRPTNPGALTDAGGPRPPLRD